MSIEPGLVYDLPNDAYHALTDWFGSTQLKGHLPEHYGSGGSKDALTFGSLFHAVVLYPHTLADLYTVLDAEVVGLKADGTRADNPTNTTAWKRAVAEVEQSGKVVIAQADWDRAHAMRDSVLAHPEAAALLFANDGRSEVSGFAIDTDGLKHKARFDRLNAGTIVDLKSTAAKPGPRSLNRAVADYGYDLSAAHYLAVAELLGLDVDSFVFVFVGKEAPYRVSVCDLDDMWLERGRNNRALALSRARSEAEPYEGATGRFTLHCPGWALPWDDDDIEVA
ncbi:MAG: PD-(D/E)XK nuclease-like domain-containing protein [Ilumatobacteraceae bacterium]